MPDQSLARIYLAAEANDLPQIANCTAVTVQTFYQQIHLDLGYRHLDVHACMSGPGKNGQKAGR